jgi:hypothetical protein
MCWCFDTSLSLHNAFKFHTFCLCTSFIKPDVQKFPWASVKSDEYAIEPVHCVPTYGLHTTPLEAQWQKTLQPKSLL